jgi:hypothetical protein
VCFSFSSSLSEKFLMFLKLLEIKTNCFTQTHIVSICQNVRHLPLFPRPRNLVSTIHETIYNKINDLLTKHINHVLFLQMIDFRGFKLKRHDKKEKQLRTVQSKLTKQKSHQKNKV